MTLRIHNGTEMNYSGKEIDVYNRAGMVKYFIPCIWSFTHPIQVTNIEHKSIVKLIKQYYSVYILHLLNYNHVLKMLKMS